MSETITLHTQNHGANGPIQTGDNDTPVLRKIVTGVELSDGFRISGNNRIGEFTEEELILSWPMSMAEKIAEYYEENLSGTPPAIRSWNCHSFVYKVMGWDIWSGRAAIPYGRPGNSPMQPDQLADHQPYAIRNFIHLRHSMLGLSNPTESLSVWGRRGPLMIANNAVLANTYGGRIYPYLPPQG